jgi:ankyrin repeat protein
MATPTTPTQTPARRAEQLFDQVSRRSVVMGRLLPSLTEGNVRHFATDLIPGSLGADWLTPDRFDLVTMALTVDWKSGLVLLEALSKGGADLTWNHPQQGTLLHALFDDGIEFPDAMIDPVCDFLLEHIDPFEPDSDGDTAHDMWLHSARQSVAMADLDDPKGALLEALGTDDPDSIAKALDGHASFRRLLGQTHDLRIDDVPVAVHAAKALCSPESLQVLKDAGASFCLNPDDHLPPLLAALAEAVIHWNPRPDPVQMVDFHLPECPEEVHPRLVRDTRRSAFATLDFILGEGADIHTQVDMEGDENYETHTASMLSLALGFGATELVRFCLERGANPYEESDAKNGLVMSFFHAGGQNGADGDRITEMLMEYGVDPYQTDSSGDSIVSILEKEDSEADTLKTILEGQRNKLAAVIPEATHKNRGPGKRI